MALTNVQQSVTLTAESTVEDQVVVQYTAHVPSNGIAGAVTVNIRDITLYNEHRSTVRRDQSEFQNVVWGKEDEMNGLNEVEE